MIILGSLLSLLSIYNICFIVGFIYILIKGSHLLKVFWLEINFPEKRLSKRYGENSYAVVTGASDGIGKAIAMGLAERKFNLVLIARNKEKLEKVEKEILSKNEKTKIKLITADFSECYKDDFFNNIMNEIGDLNVSILVNNVGTIFTEYLTKATEQQIKETILVNCMPQAVLTRHFVERFLKREKKSAIITISSLAADYRTPLWQTYGASKAFIDYFANTVSLEYPQIDVLSVKPSQVETKLTKSNSHKFFAVTPEKCAKAIFKNLGYVNETYGHWKHIFVGEGGEFMPKFMIRAMSNWVLKGSIFRSKGKKAPIF